MMSSEAPSAVPPTAHADGSARWVLAVLLMRLTLPLVSPVRLPGVPPCRGAKRQVIRHDDRAVGTVPQPQGRSRVSAEKPSGRVASTGRSEVSRRVEVLATALLALATLVTAWSAFQSTKWSGVMSNSYAAASAARAESTRASNEAGQLQIVDVTSFTSWVDAIADETRAGKDSGLAVDGTYSPVDGTQSAFLYARFRPELVPAFDAWLAHDPLHDPSAPTTPFVMDEYHPEARAVAESELERAEKLSVTAQRANQNGDNYVLMSIMFAAVALFAGLSTKLVHRAARSVLLGAAVVLFAVATVVGLTFPKQF